MVYFLIMALLGTLQDVAAKFSGLFGGKNVERIAGIDIGSSAVKVVQAHKKGGAAVLETYGALALGPYGNMEVGRSVKLPMERIVDAVRDLLREANVTTNECAISIPLSSSLITYMEMPNLETKRLASIIPIEARKYIPVPIGEVTLDWILIPREASSVAAPAGSGPATDHIDVLLVAIHNETLEQYVSMSDLSKLKYLAPRALFLIKVLCR
jgi:type IV pilus assembly protein PilM